MIIAEFGMLNIESRRSNVKCGIRNADLMQKVVMFKSEISVSPAYPAAGGRQVGEIYTEGIPLGKSKICNIYRRHFVGKIDSL